MTELFELELEKGTGFPILCIESGIITPTPKLDQIILDNILNNKSFDPQCIGSRHKYLYELVEKYQNRQVIFQLVLKHFEKMTDSDHGEKQVFGFVSLMVKNQLYSHEVFVEKFESYWEKIDSPDSIGIEEILDLEGVNGIKRIARIFGKRISAGLELNEWKTPFFEDYADQFNFNVSEILTSLKNSSDSMILLYLNYLNTLNEELVEKEEFNSDKFLDSVLRGERYPRSEIIKGSTDEQFARYCNEFKGVKDKRIRFWMLKSFTLRKFAGGIEFLISEYQNTKDIEDKISLLDAMVLFYDPRTRKLVDELYDDKFRLVRAKIVLTQFVGDDAGWILDFFETFSDHELHFEMEFFLKNERTSKVPIIAKILDILLRRMPCSICRKSIVEEIITRELLDKNQTLMLTKDCNYETRKIAKNYLAKNN